MNITYKTDYDILEVEPDGNLAERDFEALGRAFTDAEVKKFDYDRQDDAEKWLLN